ACASACEMAAHLASTPKPGAALLKGRSWPGLSPRAAVLLAQGVERQELREALLRRYEPSVLATEASAWLPRARPGGGPLGLVRRWHLRRALSRLLQPGIDKKQVELVADLQAVARFQELSAAIPPSQPWLEQAFGESFAGTDGDWKELSRQVAWVQR